MKPVINKGVSIFIIDYIIQDEVVNGNVPNPQHQKTISLRPPVAIYSNYADSFCCLTIIRKLKSVKTIRSLCFLRLED